MAMKAARSSERIARAFQAGTPIDKAIAAAVRRAAGSRSIRASTLRARPSKARRKSAS